MIIKFVPPGKMFKSEKQCLVLSSLGKQRRSYGVTKLFRRKSGATIFDRPNKSQGNPNTNSHYKKMYDPEQIDITIASESRLM